jgi:hypothetical protein
MGYLALDDWRLPGSRELIDHLVIGPAGVYAIDSERWDPVLPIHTLNGRIHLGPGSKDDRVDQLGLQARQVSEILSEELGAEINVQGALAIYGAMLPRSVVTIRGTDVIRGTELRAYLRRRARTSAITLTKEQVQVIHDTAIRALPAAEA